MRTGFYPRLAATGLSKNRRLYLPYLLTCLGITAMYYIILALSRSTLLAAMDGGDTVQMTLRFGSYVIALFALIFLFYTHSFLMRKRKREFGLYNMLGMGKWNIARILCWESLFVAFFSLLSGMALGFLLCKLAELCLLNIMHGEITYSLVLDLGAVMESCLVFGEIHLLILLNALRQLHVSSARELFSSEAAGEKPPKANWLLAVMGVLLLGAAYVLAVGVAEPTSAMLWFFVAVILVILGTYLLFIAGSVAGCRLLQKNRHYYYKSSHFVSVSSMLYRMKRNGAGLASICILATMVLVMLSSTTCLYFGVEDSLSTRYPHDFQVRIELDETDDTCLQRMDEIAQELDEAVQLCGVSKTGAEQYSRAAISGVFFGSEFEPDVYSVNYYDPAVMESVCTLYFVGLEDYNRCMNQSQTLQDDEAIVYAVHRSYTLPEISIRGCDCVYRVKQQAEDFMGNADAAMNAIPSVFVVVRQLPDVLEPLSQLEDNVGRPLIDLCWYYSFDTDAPEQTQLELQNALGTTLAGLHENGTLPDGFSYSCESKSSDRGTFYSMYGGLFFLGVLLSIVFLFAAVLIIYYKQISEGYEDQSRFAIMQKLGMQPHEIRASINSQLLTVFFLPLLGAVLHLGFAFPMIEKILRLFNLNNVGLFAATSGVSVLVFALFYALVYRTTSNAYYHIVSGTKERPA